MARRGRCACVLTREPDGFKAWDCCRCARRDVLACNGSSASECRVCGHKPKGMEGRS